MYLFGAQHCFPALLLFFCWISSAFGFSKVSTANMDRYHLPQLSQVNDSRDDGISYEAKQAMLRLHLKEIYPGRKPEDFASPGVQRLKLYYKDTSEANKSDAFLNFLENLEISKDSTWDIEITGFKMHLWNQTPLLNVLRKIPSVTTLNWRTGEAIPLNLVRFLEESHHLCRLYYDFRINSGGRYKEERELRSIEPEKRRLEAVEAAKQKRAVVRESIVNSTILHALKVSIANGGREREPWKMDLIFRILTTCPNIKELDISVARHGGCVVYENDDPYGFDFTASNTTLPPLESLTIDGYRCNGKPNGQNWMEWETEHPQPNILNMPWKYLPQSVLDYVGYRKIESLGGLESRYVKRDSSPLNPGTKTNLDIWLERMDWTHLHTFKMKAPDPEVLEKLEGGKLPGLKSVAFSGYYADHHAILRFLSNTSSPLESIDFHNINFCSLNEVVDTITKHHGSALQTFALRHAHQRRQSYMYSSQRNIYRYSDSSFFNTTQLVLLRQNCPHLARLDIDVQIPREWNYELFDSLASFPDLEYLTLRFESEGIESEGVESEVNYDIEYEYNEVEDEDYGIDQYRRVDQSCRERRALLIGVATYLRSQKVGKEFRNLETYVGWDNVKNVVD